MLQKELLRFQKQFEARNISGRALTQNSPELSDIQGFGTAAERSVSSVISDESRVLGTDGRGGSAAGTLHERFGYARCG